MGSEYKLLGKVTHLKRLPAGTVVLSARVIPGDAGGAEELSVAVVDGAGGSPGQCLIGMGDSMTAAPERRTGSEEGGLAAIADRVGRARLVAGFGIGESLELLQDAGFPIQPAAWMDAREEWTRQQVERGAMHEGEPPVELAYCALKCRYGRELSTTLDEARATCAIVERILEGNRDSEADEAHAVRVYGLFTALFFVLAIVLALRGQGPAACLCGLLSAFLASLVPNLRRRRFQGNI